MKKDTEVTLQMALKHGLTEEEYNRIIKILGRNPNFTELGIFSVMWSEHCCYKSSRPILKRFPTRGPRIILGPGENAGVIDIGDGLAIVMKIESHNHPSFIEPYQGAATGVGGILRDIFTMGARPIAILDSLRFGNLDLSKNRYIMSGVVSGISGYGNCFGVPTVGGEAFFSDEYSNNPLVNVLCVGVAEKDKIYKAQAKGIGNRVVYVGSKTGRDGIHGATMASEVFDDKSEERRPTVQVGDPFTEKLLLEACLEVMERGLIVGIQDMGAAGLTCSSSEMPARAGTGVEIELSIVPQREEGMNPYEIMLSESQERMLLVVEDKNLEAVKKVFKAWDLDVAIIGRVINEKILRVKSGENIEAEIPIDSLVNDAPVYNRSSVEPEYLKTKRSFDYLKIKEPEDLNGVLMQLLTSLNIASKEWIYRQYDHMVGINTIVLPGSDAAVLRIKGTNKAIAITTDGNSNYCYLDPKAGGMIAVAEAARNLVCSGATPLAVTDCLNFGNPENPEIFYQFERVIEGMSEACEVFNTPVVGGNVSFYNETKGKSILPTPVVGMVGLIENHEKYMTQWFKDEGDIVVLLGETYKELGGTEYLRTIFGINSGLPPSINLKNEKNLHDLCLLAISECIIKSAHDISDGGLAIALAECCISNKDNQNGANIILNNDVRNDALLFGESQSRIICSLEENNLDILEKLAKENSVPIKNIGRVGGDRLIISVRENNKNENKILIDIGVSLMAEKWRNAIALYF